MLEINTYSINAEINVIDATNTNTVAQVFCLLLNSSIVVFSVFCQPISLPLKPRYSENIGPSNIPINGIKLVNGQ